MSSISIVVFAVTCAISTMTLAFSLWIVSDERDGLFQKGNVNSTLAKCLGLVVVGNILTFAAPMLLVVLTGDGDFARIASYIILTVVWFAGIMVLFNKDFQEAIILVIANVILNWGLGFGISLILTSFGIGS
jgi:hypothetical protein